MSALANPVLSKNWIEVQFLRRQLWHAPDFSVSDARLAFLIPYAVLSLPHPLCLLLVAFADWINRQQREVIAYLQEENRVLREQLGPRPLRFTHDQRVRLAAKAKVLGRRALKACGSWSHRTRCSRGTAG